MVQSQCCIKLGRQSIQFQNPPQIDSWGSIVGKKEGEGPLGAYFDAVEMDPYLGGKNWEEAEANLQKRAVEQALKRGKIKADQISYLVAGDLQSQLTGSTFGIAAFQIPMFGVYGACSTMGESMAIASILVASGCGEKVLAVTSSHTEVAERQFRFPLSYGNQKPLSATWTVTGSGAVLLAEHNPAEASKVRVTGITVGKIVDYGMKDSMNMGACMAPAAYDVIKAHFRDFKADLSSYDCVLTGDLGYIGKRILLELLREDGIDLEKKHQDCGILMYHSREQDVHAGGSGCGCAASILASYVMQQFSQKKWKKILFVPTGALLSKISFNEGNTIPGIAHAILLEREEERWIM
ncbi:MAG: stage V sporulation protein AD [Lachnospiraceae bacterium]|nr:stage V sporulation protein AD [Lachnospiraceae bacterium]